MQRFADEAGDWALEIGAYPQLHLRTGHKYDGIVGRITPKVLAAARAAKIPVVNTWLNSPVADELPNVHADFCAAGKIAAEHLYARGLRRFVHLGRSRRVAALRHYEGVAAVAAERGCSLQRLSIPAMLDSETKWERFVAMIQLISESWQPPIGIAAAADNSARAFVLELGRIGIHVPQDLAVVTAQNEKTYCTQLFPTLSSTDPGFNRVGYEAAQLLAGLMAGGRHPSEIILVPPKELVLRDSSDFFAVSDARVARALRFMAEHSEQPITVPLIAETAGISRQNLNKLFHRHVGHTVNAELIRLRVEHFKRLLVASDLPVKALYSRSGFGTESLVYSTFKRLTGQTPLQYREERSLHQH